MLIANVPYSYIQTNREVMMKSLKAIPWLFLVLLPAFTINAQVTVKLQRPPPNKLMMENLWYVNLNNTTSETYWVYLHGEVTEEKDGLVGKATSNAFALPPGMKRITSGNIGKVTNVWYKGKYKESVVRIGKFPGGKYTVCVSIIGAESKEEFGRDCFKQNIQLSGRPKLTSPKDGAKITKNPLFTWTPPTPRPTADFNYKLRIFKVLEGQTKAEAIQSNPSWFEKDRIVNTVFRYPSSARRFEEGTYAWQIQTSEKVTLRVREDYGKSETRAFVYAPDIDIIEPISINLISPKDGEKIVDPIIDFEWTPVNVANISYSLTIWEVPEGLVGEMAERYRLNKESLADFKPYFHKEGIEETSFIYLKDANEPLEPGTYAWQVTTSLGGGKKKESDVRTFSRKVEELVSGLDCEKIKKMLEKLKAQYRAEMKKLLAVEGKLNALKDKLSSTSGDLKEAEKGKEKLEKELKKQEKAFKKPFDYLKQIFGSEATLTEYDNPQDLKQKAAGQDYIGSGGIGIIFGGAESALHAFDLFRSVTGESIGAYVKKLRDLRSQKEVTKKSLQKTEKEIQNLKAKMKALKAQIPTVEKQLAEAKKKTEELKDKINTLINAYKECNLAFNEARQNAAAAIDTAGVLLNGLEDNELPSLENEIGKLRSTIGRCGGDECHSSAHDRLREAQEHYERAREFIKQAKEKLKQAREKINTDPREADRSAKEAWDLANKAKNEIRIAKENIQGLANSLEECTPGDIRNRQVCKRFKLEKIIEVGLVPENESVEKYKKRMENYRRGAGWIKWVYKIADVLQALSTLITSITEFVMEFAVGEIQPADKSEFVDAILDNWPKIIEKGQAMQMYYIVEGHYETKETWEECDKCCRWGGKEGAVRTGPTVREIVRAEEWIIKAAGKNSAKAAIGKNIEQLTEKIKQRASWKCNPK